ncbi:unnamed protein product [marine sediment metagenome]|uniref:Uncharacterized protein n=1 Tax=marine sediment metagenome TaxID=412755 RepID=X0V7W7_9ZZZZ
MKVVINSCYGGFSISRKAFLKLREMGNKHALKETDYGELYKDGSGPRRTWGMERGGSFLRDIPRDDKDLIKIIEEMGDEANGGVASLTIVEVPDDVEWEIDEYDGYEHVAEKHRTWS